jgi:hypothetical protein
MAKKLIHPLSPPAPITILHTNGATSRNSRYGGFVPTTRACLDKHIYYEISDVDVFLFQRNLSNQGKDPLALFKKR